MRDEEVLLALAGTLLPGGAGFPSFAAAGGGGLLLARLGQADRTLLLEALHGRVAPADDTAAWTEAASRLQAVEPDLFATFRRHAYLAYYEQPAVIAAIRALGHPYNEAPLPDGYPAEPFDPARDTPRHGRGRWTDTGDVRPVALAGLELESLR